MSDKLFSIVIPAYNTVEHLQYCIESLFAQSFDNFEIILVDDASTDGTGELADRLASKDERLRVLHVTHRGVGGARNEGLKAARGEYIIFIDSDDGLVPDTLERISTRLNNKPDMIWFGFIYPDKSNVSERGLEDKCYKSAADAVTQWINNDTLPISACNKVFRRAVIETNNIGFQCNFPFGEDRMFNFDFLHHCGTVEIMSDKLYFYTLREGSASHRFVENMLAARLEMHNRCVTKILPLCENTLSDNERDMFVAKNFAENLKSSWLHLSRYYSTLPSEKREGELKQYIDLDFPEYFTDYAKGFKDRLLFAAIRISCKIRSVAILKLIMALYSIKNKRNKL